MSATAQQRDVVVIGASAGGVETLCEIVEGLPTEFPGSLLIVLHVLATGKSVLDLILTRAGNLPAVTPFDGELIVRGQIYVAPPDQHMLLRGDRISLSRGPRENGHRPAIDPLFRSAARSAGARVIGVVLSGALDDGAGGLRYIKKRSGLVIVQDPADALYPSMPEHAIASVTPNYVAPAREISAILSEEIERPIEAAESGGEADPEPDLVEAYPTEIGFMDRPPTGLTCPECGGALWEQTDGALIRFACHVGHSYSAESLVSEQGQALESALWTGLRALEERADLLERMSRRSERSYRSSSHFQTRAEETREHARALRTLLSKLGRDITPGPELAGDAT